MILGSKFMGHGATYVLLDDRGEIVFLIEEERTSRVKEGTYLPTTTALDEGLARFRIDPEQIDILAYHCIPRLLWGRGEVIREALEPHGHSPENWLTPTAVRMLLPMPEIDRFRNVKMEISVAHHRAHAASAFYPSPFEEAVVIVLDGAGEVDTCTVFHGKGVELEKLHSLSIPNSLGIVWMLLTAWLGLGGEGKEGKTMGLSAYGKPIYRDLFEKEIISIDPSTGDHRINAEIGSSFLIDAHRAVEQFENALGPARQPSDPLTDHHKNVAATLQDLTEDILRKMAAHYCRKTGCDCVCLAGGVAMNSVANGTLLRSGVVNDIFVQPLAGDNGTALGAALHAHYTLYPERKRNKSGKPGWWVQDHLYFGPDFSDEEFEETLTEYGLPVIRQENIEAWTAERLSAGKVIGWFQGRMEAGARALGNRSILVDPRRPDIKDLINKKVKFREPWRPFAPSIIEEDCGHYFDSDHTSPFMILVYSVLKNKRADIPGVVHVDGTARVQTVSKKTNPRYYKLISEFKKITGESLILNTSMNVNSEPIVYQPQDAIEDFLRTDMDILVLGNYVLDKSELVDLPSINPYNPAKHQLTLLGLKEPKTLVIHAGSPDQLKAFRTASAKLGWPEPEIITTERILARNDTGLHFVPSTALLSGIGWDENCYLKNITDRDAVFLLLPSMASFTLDQDFPQFIALVEKLSPEGRSDRVFFMDHRLVTFRLQDLEKLFGPLRQKPSFSPPGNIATKWLWRNIPTKLQSVLRDNSWAGKRVAFFGAGSRLEEIVTLLPAEYFENAVAIDSDPAKQGKKVDRLRVFSPEILTGNDIEVVILTTFFELSARKTVNSIVSKGVRVLPAKV